MSGVGKTRPPSGEWLMFDCLLQRMYGRFVPTALPPAGTFDGQTVLIVGGTRGLGLAAAVHFATLGANVIITYRKLSGGEAAKRQIEEAVGPSLKGRISCLDLDLEHYDSCTNFMSKLRASLPGPAALDVAIVSSGIINSHWEESPTGWERTIQINTIGSTLIGLLLLGWMREGRDDRESPSRMIFLSSREHLYPNMDELTKWSQHEHGILRQVCCQENWPGSFWEAEPNYAVSKLLLMYTIEEITRMARGPDGDPFVVVNSVCPGMTYTEMALPIASRSWFHNLCVYLTNLITAKTPDSGSRIIVQTAVKPKEYHGDFFNYWLTPERYREEAASTITNDKGRALQRLVWKDIIEELRAKVPGLDSILTTLH
ncbi:unnamed protein product [Clonostachys chloroleuca]|uniref:Uncharacterized protein n=1 Tax=Clonostachys chloroleuca TaxID=1926264 RepID=A0AA35Q586_9HYPO|nr:unnamed protein product [Clonostachys chloroleuca]